LPEPGCTPQKIFEHLITLKESEQNQYIDDTCSNDPELKQIVTQLIKTHNSLAIYNTDKIESELLEVLAESTEPNAPTDSIPTTNIKKTELPPAFKGYEIIQKIGSGGMGDVYLCQPFNKELKNKVAIKLLKANGVEAKSKKRFLNEQKILSRLKHPSISTFIDAGYTIDQRPYVVMEYCKGIPITAFSKNKQLSIKERIKLFLKLCAAVQHAHNSLIIHRDIKPNNILVTKNELKLLDFGISKALDAQEKLTQTGLRAMTPAYASPEQLAGEPTTLVSDVYSLGVVLYELLTETRPFSNNKLSPAQYESALLNAEPELPSKRLAANKRLSKELVGDLDLIVIKSIRSNISERFNNVTELSDELRRYQDGLPIVTNKSGYPYYIKKFIKRNTYGVVSGLVFLATILFFLALTLKQNISIKQQRDIALREQNRAETITDTFMQAFKNADPTHTLGEEIKARQVLDQTARMLHSGSIRDPITHAKLSTAIAKVYNYLNLYDESLELLDQTEVNVKLLNVEDQVNFYFEKIFLMTQLKGSEITTDYINQLPALLQKQPEILMSKANLFRIQQDYAKAMDTIQTIQEMSVNQDGIQIRACIQLGRIQQGLGNKNDSEIAFNQCLELASNHYDTNKGQYYKVLIFKYLGDLFYQKKNPPISSEFYLKSIELGSQLFGEKSISLAQTYNYLAANYRTEKKYEKSIELFQLSIDIFIEHFGKDHFFLAPHLFNFGILYHQLENYDLALKKYQQAIDIMLINNMHEDLSTAHFYQGHGSAALDKGDLLLAGRSLINSIKIIDVHLEKTGKASHITATISKALMTDVYFKQNRYKKAINLIQKISPLLSKELPPDHELNILIKEIHEKTTDSS